MILQMDAQGRGQRHPSPAGSAWLMLGGRSPGSILPPAEGWICPSLLGLWMSGPAKNHSEITLSRAQGDRHSQVFALRAI